MGVYAKYGTIAVGAYMAHQPGSHPRGFGEQYWPKWDRGGARGTRTWRDRNRWNSLWSWGCRVGFGEPSGGDGASYRDMASTDLFEPYSCDGDGSQSKNFLRGTCKDSGGTAVANAIVQGYVTATDAYLGEVQGNTDGTYSLGVEASKATTCYLVAYKAGSPDIAGTTVNTLLPTNVDGSA